MDFVLFLLFVCLFVLIIQSQAAFVNCLYVARFTIVQSKTQIKFPLLSSLLAIILLSILFNHVKAYFYRKYIMETLNVLGIAGSNHCDLILMEILNGIRHLFVFWGEIRNKNSGARVAATARYPYTSKMIISFIKYTSEVTSNPCRLIGSRQCDLFTNHNFSLFQIACL